MGIRRVMSLTDLKFKNKDKSINKQDDICPFSHPRNGVLE